MIIYDLLDTLADGHRISIHDYNGATILDHGDPEDVPEFMQDFHVSSFDIYDDGSLSIVITEETYLQAFSIMRQLVNDLEDIGECRTPTQVDETTVERLRAISRTARRLAFNIRNGLPWREDLFTTING